MAGEEKAAWVVGWEMKRVAGWVAGWAVGWAVGLGAGLAAGAGAGAGSVVGTGAASSCWVVGAAHEAAAGALQLGAAAAGALQLGAVGVEQVGCWQQICTGT